MEVRAPWRPHWGAPGQQQAAQPQGPQMRAMKGGGRRHVPGRPWRGWPHAAGWTRSNSAPPPGAPGSCRTLEYGDGGWAEALHQLVSGALLLGPVAAGVQPPPFQGDAEAALTVAVAVVVAMAMTLLLPPPPQEQQSRRQSTQLPPTTRTFTNRSSYPITWTFDTPPPTPSQTVIDVGACRSLGCTVTRNGAPRRV